MLQAYALVAFLRSKGHDVSIIDYRPDYLQGVNFLSGDPRYNRICLGWLYALAKLPSRVRAKIREHAFDKFFEEYLPVTRHYETIGELRDDVPEADCYIAGSDQIWNTTFRNGTDSAFYLDFGPENILRLSYAASFATDSLQIGTENFVKAKLANFDYISVRESSAVCILNAIGYSGVQVVDPTFLLSADEWDKIVEPKCGVEDYILVYDFMNDPGIRSIAQRLADMYHCKIYCAGASAKKSPYADKTFWKEGPITFVSLVKNARCVVSNSFHGTAFSMIYQRDFFVVNRKDGLNTRMQDLLVHYNLCERLIKPDVNEQTLKSHINYDVVNPLLLKDVIESKEWLLSKLKK